MDLFRNAFQSNHIFPLKDLIQRLPSPQALVYTILSLFRSTQLSIQRRKIDIGRSPKDFDVDYDTGFLPSAPLPRLGGKYSIWEEALASASENLSLGEDDAEEAASKRSSGEHWRAQIKSVSNSTDSLDQKLKLPIYQWPVFDISSLENDSSSLKRAHLVLAWLVHYFVHSLPPSHDGFPVHVPEALSIPLVQVSQCLGIAPILTYADTVLWNWDLTDASRPVSMDNIEFQNLFSGTEDERNFYAGSAKVEFQGVELLRIIDEYNHLPDPSDLQSISKIARDLARLKGIVEDISDIIQSIRPTCDPHIFYWDIRPWWEGADVKGPSGPGWVYDGVPDSHLLDLSGPSAGQSSVMHALDMFLDIDHKLSQKRHPAPSADNKKADVGFMERMRRYMPRQHREYLAHLGSTPRSIRELARKTPALRESYDSTIMAVKKLRDLHMRIACLYVVTMSRTVPGSKSGCPASVMLERLERSRAAGDGPVRGTGGTSLSLLLKAGRDATRRAALKDN